MRVVFLIEYTNEITCGKSVATKDLSIKFKSSVPIDAFSLYLYHWSFELATQKISDNNYLIQYAMGSLCLLNCDKQELTIPHSMRGKLYLKLSSPPNADGMYYSEFSEFPQKKYYDTKNRIFAIGDIKAGEGRCVQFAEGQFAVINDLGELIVVYIRMD